MLPASRGVGKARFSALSAYVADQDHVDFQGHLMQGLALGLDFIHVNLLTIHWERQFIGTFLQSNHMIRKRCIQ